MYLRLASDVIVRLDPVPRCVAAVLILQAEPGHEGVTVELGSDGQSRKRHGLVEGHPDPLALGVTTGPPRH